MNTVLVLSDDDHIFAAINGLPDVSVRRCADVSDLMALSRVFTTATAVVSMPDDSIDADALSQVHEAGVTTIAVINAASGATADRARALGFVRICDPTSLSQEIQAVQESGADLEPPSSQGRRIAVWGPVGAPGRTTIAINLAVALARRAPFEPTLLVDADTYGASIAQHLGLLDEVSGLLAAARAANQGDIGDPSAFFASHTVGFTSNLAVLTGLPRADLWRHVRPRAFHQVLETAAHTFTTTITDIGFCLESADDPQARQLHRNHVALTAAAKSDLLIAVTTADPVGLTRLVKGLDELRDSGLDPAIEIVVNRHDRTTGWGLAEVREAVETLTGHKPLAIVPFDHQVAMGSLAAGQTVFELAPTSPIATAILQLANASARDVTVPL